MRRRSFVIGAPLALAGCATTPAWAPQEFIDRVAYRAPGPSSMTLFTMRNVGSGNGAHTGLMINASQRVIFDPAGSFGHESIPERNDLHYGITPRIAQFYVSYHARSTFFLQIQELIVPDATAERAFRLAEQAGPVPETLCTYSTARIIRALPGFGSVRQALFPNSLARDFGRLPSVTESTYRENDDEDKAVALRQFDAELRAERASSR